MKILGIESSCDETAAAVVEDGHKIISSVVHSQIDLHKAFGGVVPEVAARSHLEVILPVIDEAVRQADKVLQGPNTKAAPSVTTEARRRGRSPVTTGGTPFRALNLNLAKPPNPWDTIDAIAVTTMPGLVGSLLIGSLTARTLAWAKNKPLYPVHHVEAHVYANFIDKGRSAPQFPLLALIVSGGHSQIVLFRAHGDYTLIGQTADDAVGEAFDKVAKMLGLPYPGGPSIALAAEHGDPHAYNLPKARMKNPYDFSFSGLKTAVLRAVQSEIGVDHTFPSNQLAGRLDDVKRQNFAASFQQTAVETLVDKVVAAYHQFQPRAVVIAGGVAANQALRRQLSDRLPIAIEYPPVNLCTDNAAMVAALGFFVAQANRPTSPYKIEVNPSISMTKTAWRLT
jgi:N6-L-threonylcarbamoyladenine synthase